LLQLATGVGAINFPEGKLVLERYREKFLNQEHTYRTAVGEAIIQLAEGVLKANANDAPIGFGGYTGHSFYHTDDGQLLLDNANLHPPLQWVLRYKYSLRLWSILKWVHPPGCADGFDGTEEYPFYMNLSLTDKFLCQVANGCTLKTDRSKALWYIKPITPGSEWFSLRNQVNTVGASSPGKFVKCAEIPLLSPRREYLSAQDTFDEKDDKMRFKFRIKA
jgi:hypothetical protein